jgi:hypothetical protein
MMGMKMLPKCAGILALVVSAWVLWKYQPWMPSGRAVRIASRHFGNCDVQVWQRKNPDLTEPFATGLFVRRQNGPWRAFLIDFEDTYRSHIELQESDSELTVRHGSGKVGLFDEVNQTFRRALGAASDTGVLLNTDPPGNWWVKPPEINRK